MINPKYSLRAFATDLGVPVSNLSGVIKGSKGLSRRTAAKIATRLGFNESEASWFVNLVMASDGRSKRIRSNAEKSLKQKRDTLHKNDYKELSVEVFKIISNWYHHAILELVTLKTFRNDNAWIAKKLGISEIEVKMAIERLMRLEMLEVKKGKLFPTELNTRTSNDISSDAIKKFHKQMLQKAMDCIVLQNIDKRDISHAILTINSKDLPEIKRKIQKFRDELCEQIDLLSAATKRDHVYSLGVQFFRITNEERL
jgi:uncharacterized protein (TIGR02147 family)